MSINLKITNSELKGIQDLKKRVAEMVALKAKVGVFGGNYPTSGKSIAEVATMHEFGVTGAVSFQYKGKQVNIKNGLPVRSFLRMPLRTRKMKIIVDKKFMKNYVLQALYTGDVEKPIKLMAINAYAIVQEAFDTQGFGQWQRNMNKNYIALKGSDTPLIDSGQLRRSVTYQVDKKG